LGLRTLKRVNAALPASVQRAAGILPAGPIILPAGRWQHVDGIARRAGGMLGKRSFTIYQKLVGVLA